MSLGVAGEHLALSTFAAGELQWNRRYINQRRGTGDEKAYFAL